MKKEKCQYSVGCKNRATTTIPHPILHNVHVCGSCKALVERLKAQVQDRYIKHITEQQD